MFLGYDLGFPNSFQFKPHAVQLYIIYNTTDFKQLKAMCIKKQVCWTIPCDPFSSHLLPSTSQTVSCELHKLK